jgi:hypothetical protein
MNECTLHILARLDAPGQTCDASHALPV